MRSILRIAVLVGLLGIMAGCAKTPEKSEAKSETTKPDAEKTIAANLAKLGVDKEAAEAQRFCAIQTKNRLGSMGVPVKVTHKDKDAFLCCKACLPAAEKDLEGTVKRAEELTYQTSIDELPPEDRKLAEAQRFCASDGKSPLGSMGAPVKIMVKGQPVFLCCGGCEKEVRKDEDKALALVKKLQAENTKK